MEKPPIPLDETLRLVSLHSMRILDSGPEQRFDRITRMAKRCFDVEMCLVSLVDSDRQWFKSKQGLEACETAREISFCGHAILEERAFVVEDALLDPRFADNPLVAGDPKIRFYAGYPVHSLDRRRIGTFCIIDSKPRSLTADDIQTLIDFAALVDDELATASQINVDELTQIANRRGLSMVAGHLLPLCQRTNLDIEVLFFDLDGFKTLNDTFGHKAGDEALKFFAGLLLKSFRSADVVCRLGGDEFVVMMADKTVCPEPSLARMGTLARATTSEVNRHVRWSVGRIKYDPERHDSIDRLLEDADARMYANKVRRRQAAG